jgi:hypothetical protein
MAVDFILADLLNTTYRLVYKKKSLKRVANGHIYILYGLSVNLDKGACNNGILIRTTYRLEILSSPMLAQGFPL